MRDGSRPAALSGREPIRLFLSGGGNRAALGGVGVVAALHRADRWKDVDEVVTVSGGGLLVGAMLGLRSPDDAADDPHPALARFVGRMTHDRFRFFATRRRAVGTIGLGLLLAAAVLLGLLVTGAVGPDGWWRSPALVLAFGLLVVPVLVTVGRRVFVTMWTDALATVTSGRGLALDTVTSERRYLACASGLSSGVPYYFWAGGEQSQIPWGEPIQEGYDVVDMVVAAASLPSLSSVVAPEQYRREPLVDGGVSGIFGEQVESRLQRDPQNTFRGEHQRLAVDAGRHTMSPGPIARTLTRISVVYTVIRWLKAALEATYVNDLADWDDTELVRLCAGKESGDARMIAASTDDLGLALDRARAATARLGIMGIDESAAAIAIATGFVATTRALAPGVTLAECEAGLGELGASLALGETLVDQWQQITAPKGRPS